MRWDDFRRSDNIDDYRDSSGGGGGGGFSMGGGGGLGIGAIVVLSLVGWAFGIDPSILIGGAEMVNGGRTQYQQPQRPSGQTGAPKDEMGNFVAAVVGNTEDVWTQGIPGKRPDLSRAASGALSRLVGAGPLRHGAGGDGAVLLPERPAHLSRHVFLQ